MDNKPKELQHDEQAHVPLLDVISEAFPWARFLPKDDVQAFLVELIGTLRAVEELGSPAPVAQAITEWRHTAEVHADPELFAALTEEGASFSAVRRRRRALAATTMSLINLGAGSTENPARSRQRLSVRARRWL